VTVGQVAAEAFAGLAWVHVRTDSFTETGGVAALTGAAASQDSVGYFSLGLRGAGVYMLANGMAVIPRATVVWQHALQRRDAALGAHLPKHRRGLHVGARSAGPATARWWMRDSTLRLNANAKVGISYWGEHARKAQGHPSSATSPGIFEGTRHRRQRKT
jgi:uncharacterized protein with beta-barrel porin domain